MKKIKVTKTVKKTVKPKTCKKSNPYKANQYKVDPRQALFLEYYFDPNSETFSNASQSALRAGFSKRYAANITHLLPTWLSESIGDQYLIRRAEQNLKEFVEMETKEPAMTAFGPVKGKDGEYIMRENSNLKRIKADVTKFTLERLSKKKYSARTELAGKDGKNLIFTVVRDNASN